MFWELQNVMELTTVGKRYVFTHKISGFVIGIAVDDANQTSKCYFAFSESFFHASRLDLWIYGWKWINCVNKTMKKNDAFIFMRYLFLRGLDIIQLPRTNGRNFV